jgi:hypothetical protein
MRNIPHMRALEMKQNKIKNMIHWENSGEGMCTTNIES